MKIWHQRFFLTAAIFSILFSPGKWSMAEEAKTVFKEDTRLVEIEGGNITMEEFRERTFAPQDEALAVLKSPEGKEKLLNELIQTRLFTLEAKRLKLNERSDVAFDIQDAIDRILSDYYLREQVYSKIKITDAEIKEYMDKNPDSFQAPEAVRVQHILIRLGREVKPDEVEAKQKKAEEILAKAKAGEDFNELVKTFSEDKSSQNKNGELGYLAKGRYGKEFDERVFNLKPGEISPAIRTARGFQIFRVQERRPAGERSLSEVRPWITSRLKTVKEQEARDAAVKDLMEKYKVNIHKELLK